MIETIIEFCNEYNISPNAFMTLYVLVHEHSNLALEVYPEELSFVQEDLVKNSLAIDRKTYLEPTDKGKRLIADFDARGEKKKGRKQADEELAVNQIEKFVDEYRKLFRGLRAGAMGDRNGCISKFVQFKKEYPEFFNRDRILAATKLYIDSLNDYQYLQQADYFIYKQDQNKGRSSRLASFCEEVDMDKVNMGVTSKSKFV